MSPEEAARSLYREKIAALALASAERAGKPVT
jgi:hypothetical protein